MTEQKTNAVSSAEPGNTAMLSLAITALFTLSGVIAAGTVAYCLIEARKAYRRLIREGEVMRAGFALQAAAIEMTLRPKAVVTPRRTVAVRRAAMRQGPQLPRPLCAAA